MGSIVLDIETYGTPAGVEGILDRIAARAARRADKPAIGDTADTLALNPYLGRVIAIGVNVESTSTTTVLFSGPAMPPTYDGEPPTRFVAFASERDMLTGFWAGLDGHAPVVTFNGRAFDLPFLMLRSAICGVKPTRNLCGYRYSLRDTLDLVEVLTFFGATRRPSLEVACHAFGITSPKGGLDGSLVGAAYEAGQIHEIARYCARDVDATAALYGALARTLLPVMKEAQR